jgi:hypothetical protein
MDGDQILEVVDPVGGEGHHPVLADADHPELTVLGVHFLSDLGQPVLVLSEHLGDVADREDVADLVDVRHDQAALAAMFCRPSAFQLHGSNSSSR